MCVFGFLRLSVTFSIFGYPPWPKPEVDKDVNSHKMGKKLKVKLFINQEYSDFNASNYNKWKNV